MKSNKKIIEFDKQNFHISSKENISVETFQLIDNNSIDKTYLKNYESRKNCTVIYNKENLLFKVELIRIQELIGKLNPREKKLLEQIRSWKKNKRKRRKYYRPTTWQMDEMLKKLEGDSW